MSANLGPHTDMHDHKTPSWWRTRSGIVLCGFLLIALFYLLTEHTAHFFGVLPFLLLLACPLMHLFMHHGGHGGHGATSSPSATQTPTTPRAQGDAP